MESSTFDDVRGYFEKAKENYLEAFKNKGIAGIQANIEEKLEEWKDLPLYVAVTGRSGVGKSSFINAIRDLTEDDEGAAETGVTETTMEVKEFSHPLNKQLILCDLPGVGTPTFSRDTYFTDQRIGFDRFDLFVILTADRFYDDDLWLAKGVEERGKKFIFIRTKIGQDVANQSRKAAYKNNPEAIRGLISTIRSNCEENLQKHFPGRAKKHPVFLIDNFEKENEMYDFGPLTVQLINDFPALKRDAFIMSLTALTPQIIDAKAAVLRERMWQICTLSALGAAVPIPGFSLTVDAGLILREALFYREQLGLKEDMLREAAVAAGVSADILKAGEVFKSLQIQLTTSGIIQFCTSLAVSEALEDVVAFAIPILGSVIAGAVSFATTKFTLERILDIMVTDAKKFNEYLSQKAMSASV